MDSERVGVRERVGALEAAEKTQAADIAHLQTKVGVLFRLVGKITGKFAQMRRKLKWR